MEGNIQHVVANDYSPRQDNSLLVPLNINNNIYLGKSETPIFRQKSINNSIE